jgi:thiol-disulfide isomerase/thioredoxin
MKKMPFKISFVGLILFALCPLFVAAQVPASAADAFKAAGIPLLEKGEPSIDFTVPLLNGTVKKEQKLSSLKGKVVFLNFWATWCPPCRSEMPSMEILYQRFKTQKFEMLAIDCAENQKNVAAFMKRNNLSFPVGLDANGGISDSYGIQAIPATFIIDQQGVIIAKVVGGLNWDNPKVLAAFDALIH